ncbi:MAG: DUF2065 domain-containing protein [Gammaproteobacteria bacterium]|nr:MAG: DUF2065 domain-containing protein [Gammaproteobacteria bacterium]RLA23562.1 MAG: DUF2065 domain-containing protein [Gammaproteobacteria bacterium]
MWDDLLAAFALVLVLEGMMPFLSPEQWKEAMARILQMDDSTVRKIGFFSMLGGALLLYLVR